MSDNPIGVRILVLHWGRNGGGPRFTYELTKALVAAGTASVVVSYASNAEIADRFEALGVPSFPVRTFESSFEAIWGLPRLLGLAVRMVLFMRRQRVDVVISGMEQVWQSLLVRLFQRDGRLYVSCVHDADLHSGDSGLVKRLMHRLENGSAEYFLAFSEAVASRVVELGWAQADRVRRSVHGAFGEVREEPRTLPQSRPVVLGMVGRMAPYKGLPLAIGVVETLIAEGLSVSLHVAGSGDPNVGNERLLQPFVVYDGTWISEDDLVDVMDGVDLLLLPYLDASQSGVAALAMARGVPMIGTPVGGLREQLEDSGAGMVVESVTEAAVCAGVKALLADPARYQALSAAGIAASVEAYSWSTVAADVLGAVDDWRRDRAV